MEFSLNEAKKIAIKFWWVVAAITVLGLLVGYVFGSSRVSTTYTASAQLEVDIKHLEGEFSSDDGTPSYLSGYNTAHSLIPTFEQTLFNKEVVLSRICDEYEKEAGIRYTPDQVLRKFDFEFKDNSLIIDLSCTTASEAESLSLLKLLCKFGLNRTNGVSSAVKLQVVKLPVYSYSTTLKIDDNQLADLKKQLDEKNDAIYDYVMSTEVMANVYLQRDEIRNGFSFTKKENGDIVWTYSSTNNDVTIEVMDYIMDQDNSILSNLGEVDKTFLEKQPDIEYFEEMSVGGPVTTSRTMFYAIVVGIIACVCGVAVAVVLYYLLEKKAKAEKEEIEE
ncbi:MAG: hypothetical protein IJF76_02135 [Clostridia bacterium]|nr:hypothetical protein [Clostridia bacterium]